MNETKVQKDKRLRHCRVAKAGSKDERLDNLETFLKLKAPTDIVQLRKSKEDNGSRIGKILRLIKQRK